MPSNLNNPDGYALHTWGVSHLAYEKALEFPEADAEFVRIAGLLHDIGKLIITPDEQALDPPALFHPIYGRRYLTNRGYVEIADAIFPHFTLKEMFELCYTLFPGYEGEELEPVTLPQKLVAYADIHIDGNGEAVTFDERMKDIRARYDSDSILVRSLDMGGEDRLLMLSKELGGD